MGKIKGSLYKIAKKDSLITLIFNLFFCFFMFGEYFFQPFTITIGIYFIIKYIFLFFLNKNNYAIFIENDGEILTSKNKKIKVEDMQIILKPKKNIFTISYNSGKKSKDIVKGVEIKYIAKVEEWLKLSGKKYAIEKDISEGKKSLIYILVIFMMSAIYFFNINYIKNNFNYYSSNPEKYEYQYKKEKDTNIYRTQNILLNLPKGFTIIKDSEGNDLFLNSKTKDKIVVFSKEDIFEEENIYKKIIFKNVIGLKNNYIIFDRINNSRFGMVYIILKTVFNKDIKKMYYINKGDCEIYIRIEDDLNLKIAIIQIFENKNYNETNIFIETETNEIEEIVLKLSEGITVF